MQDLAHRVAIPLSTEPGMFAKLITRTVGTISYWLHFTT
jgi:hypothetical protein